MVTDMTTHLYCNECQAIARELGQAYSDAWVSGDQTFRDAWTATYRLIGGVEQDAVRAEELSPAAPIRDPLRINRALFRKLAHEARSGHKIPPAAEP
jgi:hypothetical protein